MASLTQTAYYSRRIIKYGSIAVVILLILRSGFIAFKAYWASAHPPPPPAPNVRFNKLPALRFPDRSNLPTITLKLETIAGKLPALAGQAKIYFVPKPSKGILVWDNAKAWARTLGFDQPPEEITLYDYRFTSNALPKTTLETNVLSRNFTLTFDWKDNLDIISQTTTPSENQAISLTKGFLQRAQSLPSDLADGPSEALYLKYVNNVLVKALFTSEATFVKVNLFRRDIDGLRVLPPNPKDANVSALLTSAATPLNGILTLKFSYSSISENNFATYPLKDVNVAWSQLAGGKGFIANLGNNPDGKVTVRSAYLAYYDSEDQQDFLQPVFVFEGDNDFYAYVPAVSDDWLEQETPK